MPRPSPDQTLISDLEKTHQLASDEQVEKLARMHTRTAETGERVRGLYLKVLVAGCQKRLEGVPVKARRARRLSQTEVGQVLPVIEEVHGRYYMAVLRGITTSDVADREDLDDTERSLRAKKRNQRSGFARSNKSTLVSYVKAGGDIRGLDPDKVTKTELRQFVVNAEPPAATTEQLEARITRQAVSIEEVARELADKDTLAACTSIEHAMRRLTGLMQELGRTPTHKPDVARRELRPLDLGETGIFFPVQRDTEPQPLAA